MPIDFNPHVFFQNNLQPKVVNQQMACLRQSGKDTFTKNVSFGENNCNCDGVKISTKNFGTIKKSGEKATLYTITNQNGASVDISTFGATITSIKIPDKNGKLIDVVQGYNNVTPYEESPVGHAGGTIGPCANKIANNGTFIINGEKYQLECNKDNGTTHCHGGNDGFDVQNWQAKTLKNGVELSYVKKDMQNGYPGNVKVSVIYQLDNNNNLHIKYHATTDKDTLVNLTNHTYFNLDGAENTEQNAILNHYVTLPSSSKITENNEKSIPTGKYMNVSGTPFDFRQETKLADVINTEHKQLKIGSGFDHNYCVDNYDGKTLIDVAAVRSDKTGINLKVSTNLPGFQFYTSNHLGKSTQPEGKDGTRYEKRSALCVEPQFYPNAINTEEFSEKGILKTGEEYNREIVYSFSIKN